MEEWFFSMIFSQVAENHAKNHSSIGVNFREFQGLMFKVRNLFAKFVLLLKQFYEEFEQVILIF